MWGACERSGKRFFLGELPRRFLARSRLQAASAAALKTTSLVILLDGVRARLLLAGAAAAALIGVVAVVFVAAAPEESAMPSEPLRRSPAPAPAGILAPPSVPTGDTRAGAEVFVAAGFGNCHTLLAAGATGTIAPALDGRTPSYERFLAQVTEGGFGMPAYRGQLTKTEIEDVVAFVLDAIAPP